MEYIHSRIRGRLPPSACPFYLDLYFYKSWGVVAPSAAPQKSKQNSRTVDPGVYLITETHLPVWATSLGWNLSTQYMSALENKSDQSNPLEDLPKLLTADEIKDLVDGLWLLRQYWRSATGFGEIRIQFEPTNTIITAAPNRMSKRQ